MGFIMDGLDAEEYDRTYGDRVLLRRIASYFRPKAAVMALVAGAIAAQSLMQAAFPVLISAGLDRVVVHTPWIYILRCSDDSLYVGHTDNVPARVASHNDGHASRYTSQ